MDLLEQLTAALGDRCRVEGELGHGGMAVVFLAYIAVVYAGLGERDQALRYLERADEERSTVLAYLLIDPRLAPLRDEARFLAFGTAAWRGVSGASAPSPLADSHAW
jgi:hypothetical protein